MPAFTGNLHVTLRRAIRVTSMEMQTGGWIPVPLSRRMVAFDGVCVDDEGDFHRFRVSAWYAHPDDADQRNRAERSLRAESGGDVDVYVAPDNIEAMVERAP